MFTLANTYAKRPLEIKVTSPDGSEPISLSLSGLISKRNKEELDPDNQYTLLNAYVDYQGVEYKTTLYKRILDAVYEIEESCFTKGLSNPPIVTISAVLDMFDMASIEHYITDIYRLPPPGNLKPSFNDQIEADGLGTRVQTFIHKDYLELASLTLPIKVITGLLNMYAIRKASSITQGQKEYILYELIANHPIMNHPATNKLRDWAGALITTNLGTKDAAAVTVIEKQIPFDELPNYMLAIVMMQKLAIAPIVTDTRERSVVNRIYNYMFNKIRGSSPSGSRITDKSPSTDPDSGGSDKESIFEAYRMVTDLTMGVEEEFNWYAGDLDYLIRDMSFIIPSDNLNMALLEEFMTSVSCFKTIPVSDPQVFLIGYMFKKVIDPRAIEHLNIKAVINLLALGATIAWMRGHKNIAVLLCSKAVPNTDSDLEVNATPNVRLDMKLKNRLKELYPYEKQLNPHKTESVIEDSITGMTSQVFSRRWIPNAPKNCIVEVWGTKAPRLLDPGFKDMLAKYIIDIEECAYA